MVVSCSHSIFAPHSPLPLIPKGDPKFPKEGPMPPILGGEYIQSPPDLGDLGGIAGFMQEI
jgi:hypothetical protein